MLAILSVLIIVHEVGHYSVARLFGFQTPVFGFGLPFLGPYWVVGRRWGTEFRFHALLLGGYVAIPELGDESQMEADLGVPLKPFRKFPIWQRVLVAAAGVAFNVIFAYLIMLIMFLSLGQPVQPTVVHSLIKSNPIALNAGVKAGDQLLSVEGVKVTSPDDAVHLLTSHKAQEVHVVVVRQGRPLTLAMTTNAQGKVGMALISKGRVTYERVGGNFLDVAWLAAVRLYGLTMNMFEALGQLFSGVFAGGGGERGPALGIQDLHGVFAVIKIGADIAQQDWTQLFLFTIMISMDLAIINMIPWPALDGGHIAFMALEAVRGKPMAEKPQGEIMKWGVITLLVLMALVTINDITAWFEGKLNIRLYKGDKEKVTAPDRTPAAAPPSGAPAPSAP